MTCIVGIVDKENCMTYIGGDSLGSNPITKTIRKDRKVFKLKVSNICVGFTSSFRMGNLLTYSKDLVKENEELTHETVVTDFIPRLIKLFSDGGIQKKTSDVISCGTFLIAQEDKLFQIESDYQVSESFYDYDSCGNGSREALGSLYSTQNLNLTPIERIHLALRAASEFAVGVSGPFYIINTKNDDVVEFLN